MMKHASIAIAATALASGIAVAGPYQEPIPHQSAPPPSPMWEWFAGASGGYLLDLEEEMYHAHIGMRMKDWSGWSTSIFLEGGYAEPDDLTALIDPTLPPATIATVPFTSELRIIPVTLNFRLERSVTDWLNLYVGAGAGIAFVDYDGYANFAGGPVFVGDSDEVFTAQIFAGVGFDVTDNFELYTGARWIYMDTPSLGVGLPGGGVDFDNDYLVEAGFRFSF